MRNKLIANRLEEVLLNGRWIANTNFKAQLMTITWQQSIYKIADLNTIAALTYHVNYYLAGILNVFEGGELEIQDQYSFDLPPIKNEEDWKNLLYEFLSNSEKFISRAKNMSDEKLDDVFVDEKYGTYLRNMEGVVEHSYYHLGQIVIIKKMIEEEEQNKT